MLRMSVKVRESIASYHRGQSSVSDCHPLDWFDSLAYILSFCKLIRGSKAAHLCRYE